MSIHTKDVFEYLDTHPVSKYEGDFQSLLEMLHYIYTTCNPVDGERIREDIRQLGDILKPLPVEADNAVGDLVSDLCYEHQKTAFYYGMTVGMHLMTEVNALT